jgi:hypothetical protein
MEDEMGGECRMHEEIRNSICRSFVGKLEELKKQIEKSMSK